MRSPVNTFTLQVMAVLPALKNVNHKKLICTTHFMHCAVTAAYLTNGMKIVYFNVSLCSNPSVIVILKGDTYYNVDKL